MKNTEFSGPGGKPVDFDGIKGGRVGCIKFEAIQALFIAEGIPRQPGLRVLGPAARLGAAWPLPY